MAQGIESAVPVGVFSTQAKAIDHGRKVAPDNERLVWVEKFVVDDPGFYGDVPESEYIVWTNSSTQVKIL
jgi:hypothetical protein